MPCSVCQNTVPNGPPRRPPAFREYDRMYTSWLDLAALDFAPFAGREATVQAAGLLIEVARPPEGWSEAAQRRLHALIASRVADMPGTVGSRPWPFRVWQERVGDTLNPEGVFVAVDPQGAWVGLSELFVELEPGVLHTGLTGVEPQWQGRGVALALKVASLRSAQARGYREVRTSNHVRNAAMLSINRTLGFVPDPATPTHRLSQGRRYGPATGGTSA